jgi:hypothetical protein
MRLKWIAALLIVHIAIAHSQNNSATRIEAAFQKFWAAGSPAEATRMASGVAKSGVTFDEAFRRLKLGRTYKPQSSGVAMLMNRTSDGTEHYYAVNVPAAYDPARPYQVRFQLHGGVGATSDSRPRNSGEIGALAGVEQFYVVPFAWEAAPWWSEDQVLNLTTIVDTLKRSYNIDENRVVVSGVSDGGTGAYYVGMFETTAFASFLPLNGFIMVLSDNEIDDGRLFPHNLVNKPLFVINGGLDRLYPTSAVEPFTKHLIAKGVDITYHPRPEAGHNTAWWPEEKAPFEKFVADHPRNPHPEKLSWETADFAHNRAHWLVIDQFGKDLDAVTSMADVNVVGKFEPLAKLDSNFGSLFTRTRPSGRVDVMRAGNNIQATTKGVAAFTLLLSPDVFDLTKPIKVTANGRAVFDGLVERKLETLLKWAARDNDRTMLYAAELKIKL